MWYVYIIRSINFPEQEYIGATADLKRRMSDHNAGKSAHTSKFKPWGFGLVLRLSGQIQSACFREISQIPLRPGICEEASLMLNAFDVIPAHLARNAHDD